VKMKMGRHAACGVINSRMVQTDGRIHVRQPGRRPGRVILAPIGAWLGSEDAAGRRKAGVYRRKHADTVLRSQHGGGPCVVRACMGPRLPMVRSVEVVRNTRTDMMTLVRARPRRRARRLPPP